ncbi:MAG: lysylphosphatidylglycerol synthase domain-containing protein [Parvularculaceae bacterium]
MRTDLLASRLAAIRAHVERRRSVYFALFFTLFIGGLAWSFAELGPKPDWTFGAFMLLDLLVLAPMGVAAAAFNLQSCAALFQKKAPLRDAFGVTAAGVIGDLAPLPAGYVARGAFLSRLGLTFRQAGAVLFASTLTGLAIASGAVAVMFIAKPVLFSSLLAFALASLMGSAMWMSGRPGAQAMGPFLLLKAAGFLVLILRLGIAMRAIGVDAGLADLSLLVFASMAGGLAPITPGGLGLREGLAAALAAANGFSPAAAFLALCLCRISGAASCALILAAREGLKMRERRRASGNAS